MATDWQQNLACGLLPRFLATISLRLAVIARLEFAGALGAETSDFFRLILGKALILVPAFTER